MSPDSIEKTATNLTQLHVAVGRLEGMVAGIDTRIDDFAHVANRNMEVVRQTVQELGTQLAGIVTNCPRHEGRLNAIESSWHDFREKYGETGYSRVAKPTTGPVNKAVTQADLDRAKDDAVRQAQAVIEEATEKKRDKFKKNVTWLLGTLAALLSLLGIGSVVSIVRYMEKMDAVIATESKRTAQLLTEVHEQKAAPKVVYIPAPVNRDAGQ